jgi:putative tryptophan/tyrosine transport system ATP-binding protein
MPLQTGAATSRPQLQLIGIRKRFPGPAGAPPTLALDQLSETVDSGQIVGIVGSNGAGKSTLLSVIAGSLFPDEGAVMIDGHDVTAVPSWRRARYVGRVKQNPELNLLGPLTIEENFALAYSYQRPGFRLKGALTHEVRDAAREALRPFGMGLEGKLGSLSQHLSGGQRQAVAVAMATMRRPSVLLLDEHVASLDPTSARLVMDETWRIVREFHITTVMVTHDMGRALAQSDRLLMMHRGRVVLDLSGQEKAHLTVTDLVNRFERESGAAIPDSAILTDR